MICQLNWMKQMKGNQVSARICNHPANTTWKKNTANDQHFQRENIFPVDVGRKIESATILLCKLIAPFGLKRYARLLTAALNVCMVVAGIFHSNLEMLNEVWSVAEVLIFLKSCYCPQIFRMFWKDWSWGSSIFCRISNIFVSAVKRSPIWSSSCRL